jgi:hypothetical protein
MAIQALNPSISDAQSKIINLQDRPPFMLAADLADYYQVEPRAVAQAVKRNPDRFPDDFCFQLSEVETATVREKWSQNVITSQGSRTDLRPLGFSEAGALALSGVLKSARAAEVSVLIHRAFAAMMQERRRLADSLDARAEFMLTKQNRLWWQVKFFADKGWPFDNIRAVLTNAPAWKVALAVNDMAQLGLLPKPPAGSPNPRMFSRAAAIMDGRGAEADIPQADMFAATAMERIMMGEADA